LEAQGDLVGARKAIETALTSYDKALGPIHPTTNRARTNFARLHLTESRPMEALALSEAALAAHEEALGADHPWTKGSATVKANALDALGRADEAAAVRARYGIKHAEP
jgi:hypothetical protein